MRSLLGALVLSFVALGCGSADAPPLGGPYGGTVSSPAAPSSAGEATGSGSGSGATAGDQSTGSATSNTGAGNAGSGNTGSGNTGSGNTGSGNTGTGTGSGSSTGSGGNTGTGSGSGSQASDTPDAGDTPPVVDAAPPPAAAPTWSQIYADYLGSGTDGRCTSCHSQMGSASAAYTWLTKEHQLGGSTPELVSSSSSILSWFCGSMPPSGPSSDATATAAMEAWVAAGAQNN